MKTIMALFVLVAGCYLHAWGQPTGTLNVRVYDITTGTALNNAAIQVTGSGGTNRACNTSGGNECGFGGLPISETYTIAVSRADYRSRTRTGVTLTRDTSNYIDIYLTSTLQTVGVVEGFVRNAMNGQILSDAVVSATLNGRTVVVYTNASGRYRIEDLPRGIYSMGADAMGYHPQSVSADVTPGATANADFVLAPLSEPVGNLYGFVFDILSGVAANDATVTLISDQGWSLVGHTGGGNAFRWNNLPVRFIYRLAATATNYRATSRVNLYLSPAYETRVDLFAASTLTSVGTLQGTVYDIRTGNPIPNAFVQVATVGSGRPVSVMANNSGVFQINDLPPIVYNLYAASPDHYDQTLFNLQLEQGANTANILLTPYDMGVGAFFFRAFDFGTGANVNNTVIRVTAPNGRSMTTYTGSGSNGVGLGNLPPNLNLLIEAFAPNYRNRSYAGRRTRLGITDTFDIWFVSQDINTGRLLGRVTDLFTGAGIPNASVFLSQINTGRWALTYTDVNGNINLNNLFPGTYNVTCDAAGYAAATAFNVPIAVGDNLLQYALRPYGYPSGQLYGDVINAANNQGIGGSSVLLISSTGTTRLTHTGGGSFYDFQELPYDLRYTVIGSAPGFQPRQIANIEVPAFSSIRVNIPLNAGAGGLVGRLVLDSFNGNPAGLVQALVQIRDRTTNQVVREETVMLGDSGAFVVPNLPSGTYKVRIKAQGWLARLTDGITVPNLIPVVFQSDAPGDVNNDNIVNDGDLLAVLFAFGNPGGPEDLNRDGAVNDADLLLVLFNFGAVGDN